MGDGGITVLALAAMMTAQSIHATRMAQAADDGLRRGEHLLFLMSASVSPSEMTTSRPPLFRT